MDSQQVIPGETESAEGWFITDGAVGSMPVAAVQPGWSRGADGFIEAELDGQPAVVWHGPTMWADDVYFKFGLYRPQLEPNPAGGLVAQAVYFNRLRRATSRQGLNLGE